MSNTNFISGNTPLAYAGVAAKTPPNIFKYPRSPNTSDSVGYALGDLWLRSPANTPELWALISLIEYTAIWVKLYPSTATGIEFVTDAGTANPLAGILNVLGDGVGINTSATGNTITIHADSDVAEIYRTDLGDAAPSSGVLRVAGGVNINTIGSGNIVTIALDDDVSLSGTLTVDGNATFNSDVTITSLPDGVVQTTSGLLSSSSGTDGQVLIGATAGAPAWANITSTGASVTITNGPNSINLESASGSGGTIVSQFTGSATWTKNASTHYMEVYGWCGGGGGASGALRVAPATASSGGGGGGSYGVFYFYGPAFCFEDSVAITIGDGGMGGSGAGSGDPNPGGDGGPTYFGDISTRAAQNSSPLNGSGGGGWNNLQPSTMTPGYAGDYTTIGLCVDALNIRVGHTAPTYPGTGTNSNGINGTDRKFVSNTLSQPGVAFNIDYGSFIMSGTGGGGAGVTIATPVANTGGKGGSIFNPVFLAANLVEGGAGGNENTSVNGANGSTGVTGTAVNLLCGGSGGGGGGNQAFGGSAGNGGNGGFPGGGGGGGGGCVTGSTGSGGNGAGGLVIVIEYL